MAVRCVHVEDDWVSLRRCPSCGHVGCWVAEMRRRRERGLLAEEQAAQLEDLSGRRWGG